MPASGSYMVPVDGDYFFGYLSFINSETGNGDIFVNEWPDNIPEQLEGFINLSDSPYEETNPCFFNGHCYMYWCDLVLTWESYRNGHWQIYYSMSELACAGGTPDPSEETGLDLSVFPNPARSIMEVSYTLPENSIVTIKISTMDGRHVLLLDKENQTKGDHLYQVDLCKIYPATLSGRICMISLQTAQGSVSKKIIVML